MERCSAAVVVGRIRDRAGAPEHEDRFEARAAELGRAVNGSQEITSGLEDGDHVVTQGSFILKSQLLKGALEDE